MDLISNKINFYIQLQLKLLLLFTMLFIYKYIYINRINQETFLRLFIIIAFSLWLLRSIILEKLIWEETKLSILIFLFILIMAISLLRNEIIFVGLKDFINILAYFLLFFLIINCVYNKKQFLSFLKLYFIIACLVALYTFIQYYGFDPFFKEFNGLTSTLGQKNWISNYIAMIFPVIISFFLLKNDKKIKLIYYLLLSFLYANFMICQSRGIWISIFVSSIIGFYFIYKIKLVKYLRENRKWLIILILTFLIITVIFSTNNPLNKSTITVVQRAATTFDKSDTSINTRLLIWKTSFNMIKDNPLFGSGIGTFKVNYQNYQADYLLENPEDIKYSFYSLIIDFFNVDNEKKGKEKIIVIGLCTGITCFLIHSLFSFPLHVPALGSAFFMMTGLTVRFAKGFNLNNENQQNRIVKKINFKNSKLKIVFIVIILVFAIFLINNIVVKPYISELYYFKGMIFNLNYKFKDSLPLLGHAVDLSPHNGRIVHALGATYYNLNRYDEAIEYFSKARKYEIDKYIFYLSGLCYFNKKMYEEAREEFKYAIYLEPKFMEAYNDLGYLYFIQGKYDDTIQQWNKIVEIEPNFPNKYIIFNNLGIVYLKKGMPVKALKYFLKALKLAPEGSPIIEEIENEIYNIYKSKLEN